MTEIFGGPPLWCPISEICKKIFPQINVKRLTVSNKNEGALLHIFLINIMQTRNISVFQKNFMLAFTACLMSSYAITEAVFDI